MPQGELGAVLAPIALYPDSLLTPLLMATTYPDEMIAADGWRQKTRNARLGGAALAKALAMQPWAPSVKALVPFPVLLDMLATRPVWMQRIGQVFLGEPAASMREIQRLRRAALATGKLTSNRRLVVTEKRDAILIAPPRKGPVYVPVYNAAVTFGAWGYPYYPPVYIQPPPGFHHSGAGMETGIGYSRGRTRVTGLWGWARLDWRRGAVTLDLAVYNRINRYAAATKSAIWHHEPHPAGYFQIPETASRDHRVAHRRHEERRRHHRETRRRHRRR